ncbi:hypothetical protein SADUNF_Sadunf07G0019800 [Salix dunnii]|uniref:Uncharacterized protein n=1 Tax=Salix dunnii TaxID=1413687 RepID=A0A835MTH5_9ROSI|nr:hypothetical protein SADUNF_Sadunf07G0019800 [Salix dunnii]
MSTKEEGSSTYRGPHPHLVNVLKQRRSGYEPSDTETDWQDSPMRDQKNGAFGPESPIQLDLPRNVSPLKNSRRFSLRFDDYCPTKDSVSSPPRRRHSSKSPYKPRRDDGNSEPIPNQRNVNPLLRRQVSPYKAQREEGGDVSPESSQGNASPLSKPDQRRQLSPYKAQGEEAGAVSPESSQRNVSPLSKPDQRRQVSPYKAQRGGGAISPKPRQRNVSPLSKPDKGRQISPFKSGIKEHGMHEDGEIVSSNRMKNQRMPTREERSTQFQFDEDSRLSERRNASRRMEAAPKQRDWDKEQVNSHDHKEQKGRRSPSPLSRSMSRRQREREVSHAKAASVGELNGIVANIKLSKGSMLDVPNFESTESISPGDIFFSVDQTALGVQKNGILKANNVTNLYMKPASFPHMDSVLLQRNKVNGNIDHNSRITSTTSFGSGMTVTSAFAASRQSSSKLSSDSSASGRTSGSLKKFAENRKKKQTEAWFSCMRKGPCKTSKSPERKRFDETSFIEKAFVVESLRQFWADKHQPNSLNGFTCHKQEAQILGQLVSHDSIPHILLKGPSGSGKKALAMALIGEIFGDACWNEQRGAAQVAVPITSSAHHVEINVNSEPNAKKALMGLVKEISNTYAITPDVSNANFKPDYKVLVLYEVDKAPENIQPLIKWIMDCYTDACKLILCCEDDSDILEIVKNRCKVIKVDAPVTHEIMEVLIQIARKEEFDLPMNFAAKIAAKSKQNLRKAIMALEACKAHNYPFSDDQPIPFGWEEVLVELATEILIDPSPNKLFSVRGKLKRLLVDFVHPKLILLVMHILKYFISLSLPKLVELFLKGVEANSRRELYYWHAYYDKRLPTGTTALLKLEEFVAKFMSMYRKSSGTRQFV